MVAAAGVLVFHNVKHTQTLRSMDCTSQLMKKKSTFFCSRTICVVIIENVFACWSKEELKNDLSKANSVSLYCDVSNHGNVKLFPILVRYFDSEKGIFVSKF